MESIDISHYFLLHPFVISILQNAKRATRQMTIDDDE